jgi:intracellular septation protein
MTPPDMPGSADDAAAARQQKLKFAIELGPLAVFLIAWLALGMKWATGLIMIATVISMIASHRILGRISPALIATTVLVIAFGALTLLLDDPRFIQMKPTMVYALFAAALFISHIVKKPALQVILGEALQLTDEGWRKLSLRWGFFFAAMAVVNEIVRQMFTEGTWVAFKVAGFPVLTILFIITQAGMMQRYQSKSEAERNSA